MSEAEFRLPRSSFSELCKVIAAYGHFEEAAPLDTIASLATMNRTSISANNAFLSSVGLVTGGKLKAATPLCVKLGRALQLGVADEEAAAWREVVAGNTFLSKMVLAVRIRKGMDQDALESHIAFSSGERKLPQTMAGARAVVEMLLKSQLLTSDEEGVVTVADAQSTGEPILAPAQKKEESGVQTPTIEFARLVDQGVTVVVQLRVTATPDQLDGLGPRLRSVVDDLRASGKPNPKA